MGMLAILRAGDYIYLYSAGGPSRLIVTRVHASDDTFDASNYETLDYGADNVWSASIRAPQSEKYSMMTASRNRKFGCMVYGSVYYSNHFNNYIVTCNVYMIAANMYVSDSPRGPWSEDLRLLRGRTGYGRMVHPMYSTEEALRRSTSAKDRTLPLAEHNNELVDHTWYRNLCHQTWPSN